MSMCSARNQLLAHALTQKQQATRRTTQQSIGPALLDRKSCSPVTLEIVWPLMWI
jgi:hypothetical protein